MSNPTNWKDLERIRLLEEAVKFAHDNSDVRLNEKWANYMALLGKGA